jgi:hypothetical protein
MNNDIKDLIDKLLCISLLVAVATSLSRKISGWEK